MTFLFDFSRLTAAKKDDTIPDNNTPQKEKEEVNGDKEVPESSGNSNPTASTEVSANDSFELASSSTVETEVPTVSTHVLTGSLSVPLVTLSVPRIISMGGSSYLEPLSLGNAMSFKNRLEDFFGDTSDVVSLNDVEADLSNMETAIQYCLFSCFLSQEEPKKIVDALKDPSWVEAMQQELLQFKIQNVWVLVDCPKGVRPIETKWVLKNKKDERGIVIRNKARLVAQGHTQEERINYEEVFAPVAKIEAIRLFLAYASYMGFTVYQMDVKSVFLYRIIDEEYLLDNNFQRGTIDQTLFIKKYKREFLLVQVYIDDIIFGLSNPKLCREFEILMHDKFQMSAMGELNFFLGLQILQKKDGIFLSQDKYVGNILKKFGYTNIRSEKTPMDRENPWGKDETECHLHAVKKIFRYLKGHSKLGLWYPKESLFDLVAYSNSDYGGANQDRKSTTRGCQFLGRRLISWQSKKQTIVATFTTKAEYVAVRAFCDYHNMVAILEKTEHNTDFHQIVDFLEASHIRTITRGTIWIYQSKVPSHRADETAFPTGDARYEEAFPTVPSLDTGQDRENISKTSAMPHEALPRATSLGGGEGRVDQGEDFLVGDNVKDSDKIIDKGSDSTDDMANVLGTLGATNILASGGLRLVFTTASTVVSSAVATASGSFPTAAIFTTVTRRTKEKGKMTEPKQPSKEKALEQMSAQLARDLEAKFAQEDQIIKEQAERDSEIVKIHAERELDMMIAELDRSNEIVAKYLSEYEQVEVGLLHDENVELIDELLMYQRNLAQIKKYQAQQNKPTIKTERRNFYMLILRSIAGWKAKDFKGMTFEQIEEKFIPVWEKMQDFVPMNSKLESERLKRLGIQLGKEGFKKLKTAEATGIEPTQEQQSEEPKELSEEDLKKIMKLVPLEELYIEALQVELKRLYEPDPRDLLWALQIYMHDPFVWRLYDTCGVHHVSTGRGHEIFILVEKDYPLTKGLTTLMLCNKLQVDQYLEMANELLMKIYVIANSPR
nr:hypothetical protein [Tanacetum cinerariifolium]